MASRAPGRSPGHRRLVVILSMTALLCCADDALGQPTDADRGVARTRMAEGRTRRQARDLRGALESFRAADSLLHFPTTALAVARAESELGLLLQARETLRRILDVPGPSNDLPQFQRARAQAAGLVGEVELSIPTLRITPGGAPTGTPFTLAVDGVTILPAAAAAPQRMNPGHHVVVATTVSGSSTQEVDLAPHEARELVISLPAQPEPRPAAVAPEVPVPEAADIARAEPRRSAQPPRAPIGDRTLLFVGFGAACLGAAVGAVAGIASISYTKSAENGCSGGRCPPATHDDLWTAHTFATVSNVSIVVAGMGVVAGIIGLLQQPKTARPALVAALTPWLAPGAGGVDGAIAF
jgi:hypothetical protein